MFVKYSFWKFVPDSENNNLHYKNMVEIDEKELSENQIKNKLINYLYKKYFCESYDDIIDLKLKIIDKI